MTDLEAALENRDHVARIMRDLFIQEKSAKIRKKYKPSPRHDKFEHWQKAAETCIKNKAAPVDWVRAAFSYCRQPAGPFANMMAGAAAESWYRTYLITLQGNNMEPTRPDGSTQDALANPHGSIVVKTELELLLRYAQNALLSATGSYDTSRPEVAEALASYIFGFMPSVRVLLGFPDRTVLERFHADAMQEFMQSPAMVQAAAELGLPIKEIMSWTP